MPKAASKKLTRFYQYAFTPKGGQPCESIFYYPSDKAFLKENTGMLLEGYQKKEGVFRDIEAPEGASKLRVTRYYDRY